MWSANQAAPTSQPSVGAPQVQTPRALATTPPVALAYNRPTTQPTRQVAPSSRTYSSPAPAAPSPRPQSVAPTLNAPRSTPTYSAPRSSPAPSYSAPTYSAPAYTPAPSRAPAAAPAQEPLAIRTGWLVAEKLGLSAPIEASHVFISRPRFRAGVFAFETFACLTNSRPWASRCSNSSK